MKDHLVRNISRVGVVFSVVLMLLVSINASATDTHKGDNDWEYIVDEPTNYQNALKIGKNGGLLSLVLADHKKEVQISSSAGVLCEGFCTVLLFVDSGPPEAFKAYYENAIVLQSADDLFDRIVNSKTIEATVTLAGGRSTTFLFDTSNNPLVLNK
ncbi:hypothetical protein [Serratia marcescens]|uniref:hypothetical protein n=1 Tax=Serratia marcescens TaxID=615 RepID=UPI001249E7A1|nr:hypothetical protein [Serratia marcescens]KAB1578768.1 hypothetical protein F7687_22830 [Serratia marcescens]